MSNDKDKDTPTVRRAWRALRSWMRRPNVRLMAKTVALCVLAVATSPWWVALYRILLYGAAMDQAIILCSVFIIGRIIIARRRWRRGDAADADGGPDERRPHGSTRNGGGNGKTRRPHAGGKRRR
ncbi:hypothetical protein [Bifidobacterium castoris]|uniref:Uncharacterized protein n=1 Tax=Bifidobacterium castoris TaxID=2306972 RepID=A0A430FAJ8_9BIFI|nr:hypothetical protein [Bifidobacterium castoris]RSX49867.1 hypothetical protein D2E22_0328 [Bifidobacterium castoris]